MSLSKDGVFTNLYVKFESVHVTTLDTKKDRFLSSLPGKERLSLNVFKCCDKHIFSVFYLCKLRYCIIVMLLIAVNLSRLQSKEQIKYSVNMFWCT